jgi:hypothetical protein
VREPPWRSAAAGGERGAAPVRGEARAAEHRTEGAADGLDDVDRGAVLSADDYAARHADAAGGAHPRGRGVELSVVQRMWEELPPDMKEGPLKLSRSNAGQMVFAEIDSEFRIASAGDEAAGRGLSVQNLHCSEVSRWPGDAAATLAGLRAALSPDGELVLESTPNGAYGAFYDAWMSGVEDGEGLVRHFLPWWMEPAYVGPAVDGTSLHEEEHELMQRHNLSAEQIGFRRGLEAQYGVLRSQEFAEDAETCFRATGCVLL